MLKIECTFVVFLFFTVSCNGQDSAAKKIDCKHHDIVISYTKPWTMLSGLDTKEQSLIGVIDYRDGASYIIKVTQDVSKGELSDEVYFSHIRDIMLKENPENKLLEEKEADFHGKIYHRQIFLLHTKKWGLLKHYYSGLRSGDYYYGVQVSFPVTKENAAVAQWPEKLVVLDKNVLIAGQ